MISITELSTISKDTNFYSSFPDIIQSRNDPEKFFLVYREADQHHPTWSDLIFMVSKDQGKTWKEENRFNLTLKKDQGVWNCPRLFYLDDGSLNIICDIKTSIHERYARFSTAILKSGNNGRSFVYQKTSIPGMVPDKIFKFGDYLFCANHKIKSSNNDLIQLISWSRDDGQTWFDTNILAHDQNKQFCEASIVNKGSYLIAYLRDNSGHKRNIYYTISEDGIFWEEPRKLRIYGQRVTALQKDHRTIIGSYRNTHGCNMSIFTHDIINEHVKVFDIDWEHSENQYHFGYSGLSKIDNNQYLIAYYIKQDNQSPFIKVSLLKF